MSIATLPGAAAAVTAYTYVSTWVDGPTSKTAVPSVIGACSGKGLFTALIKLRDLSAVQMVARYLICTRIAFLDALHVDRAGIGALLIYGAALLPFALRLSYYAASPNRTSVLQGPVLPILAFSLASVDALLLGRGIGICIPPLLALVYVAGARASTAAKSQPGIPALPCATRAIYGANLATILSAVLIFSATMHSHELANDAFWWERFASAQVRSAVKPAMLVLNDVWPLVLVAPILLGGFLDVSSVRDEAAASKLLQEYQAEEIAYGFERTWAYYRQTGLLSAVAHIFGMSMLVRCVVQDRTVPSPSTQYLLLVAASVMLAHGATIAADILTASEADSVDKEARDAIAKAPAGNPGLEDNFKALLILALVSGPSLPAMLWHAHGEEVRGWKGRRAWRMALASKSQ